MSKRPDILEIRAAPDRQIIGVIHPGIPGDGNCYDPMAPAERRPVLEPRAGETAAQHVSKHDQLVHRAAAGDTEALQDLLEVSFPIVRRACPPTLRSRVDDIQQIVAYRLVRKFRSPDRPYSASTFAAYCSFVNRVTINISRNIWRRERQAQSLEQMNVATGFEPAQPAVFTGVDKRMCLERCAELLPDLLAREVFRCRFIRNQSVEETVATLRSHGETVTKKDVYRLVERSILYLSKLPEVRDMFENESCDA